MKNISRRLSIYGFAALIIVLVFVFMQFIPSAEDKYEGLTLIEDVQMTDETRNYLEYRLAVDRAALEAQISSDPEDFDWNLFLIVAEDANMLGDLVLEREMYEEYLSYNPINPAVMNNYGNNLYKMGDIEGAESAYKDALNISTKEEYYADLVRLYERGFEDGTKDEEILILLKELVATEGQSSWSMVKLAEWYLDHGECSKAFDHYEVAVVLSPANESIEKDYNDAKSECK